MLIEVTHDTNTIDAFCRAHLGGDSDQARARFVRWNRRFLERNQTFFLPVGRLLWAGTPTVRSVRLPLLIGGRPLLLQGRRLLLPFAG